MLRPIFSDGKWYIEVKTTELGNVWLLDKHYNLPIPLEFNSEKEAYEHIKKSRETKINE